MERKPAMTSPSPPSPPPRVLLVEDDPVSSAFLAAAIAVLPIEVDVAATCATALHLARDNDHRLLLIDANLPDGNGRDLLRALRMRAPGTPALAHTASRDRTDLDALIDAGFAEVLIKPLAAGELQAAVRRALKLQPAPAESTPQGGGKLPVWDDAGAAAALDGNHAHVVALRKLFLAELPAQRDAVLAALLAEDAVTVRATLHRLQASCGFVGAARLGQAVGTLQASPASNRARDEFEHAVEDVLGAATSPGPGD